MDDLLKATPPRFTSLGPSKPLLNLCDDDHIDDAETDERKQAMFKPESSKIWDKSCSKGQSKRKSSAWIV